MMDKKKSKLVKIVAAIVIVFLLVFGSHISSTLEVIVLGLCGIAALTPAFLRMVEGGNMRGKDMLFSVLLMALFGCFFYWHTVNEDIRRDEKHEKIMEQNKKDEIEKAKQDSVKWVQIKAQSDSLYKIEGNRIFGDFYFGMSEKDFNAQVERIKKEADGYVSIQGYDYYIEPKDCGFFHDQLYEIKLVSKYQRSIEYEYTRDEQLEIIESEEQKLFSLFKNKYGEPHDEKGWHFPYKDITVYFSCINPFANEEYEWREWASFICISQPDLKNQADEEWQMKKEKEELKKQEEKARADSMKRVKEEQERKKKESFVEGI